MDGGDVSVEGKVMCASWIKWPKNAHLVVIEKSAGTCSSLEIFSFNSENTSLSSSLKATYLFKEGGEPVRIAVHPSGDDFVCSTTIGCKLFELYGHEDNIKFVSKEFSLQDVGPQKCTAFSVDGSKLAIGGVDGHFRLFEWPTMHIIVDEPKAHKSFIDMDFSVCAIALISDTSCSLIFLTLCAENLRLRVLSFHVHRWCRQNMEHIGTVFQQLVIHFYVDVIISCLPHCRMRILSFAGSLKMGQNCFCSLLFKKGKQDDDVCVFDVTISSLHKRLHLGTNITSLEFCPSESVGLLAPHFSYVKNINPGLLLFFFNYNNWELYGIYEAASSKKMNINPYGCTLDGFGRTEFSAQIRPRLHYKPLAGTLFKPIIQDNYYNDQHHFMVELDRVQAANLISKFSSCVLTLENWSQ
ncbi:hypothetical protein H5410_005542 [Solanum commersonii]|uniref:DCD domain-containing protein n=1 Tax=Solanum commersonii TaxID=4109 RepID=A0A9J6A7U5_SOLCO|nr:hypothetical protein H5410_005542 [Solanum commersonii]